MRGLVCLDVRAYRARDSTSRRAKQAHLGARALFRASRALRKHLLRTAVCLGVSVREEGGGRGPCGPTHLDRNHQGRVGVPGSERAAVRVGHIQAGQRTLTATTSASSRAAVRATTLSTCEGER